MDVVYLVFPSFPESVASVCHRLYQATTLSLASIAGLGFFANESDEIFSLSCQSVQHADVLCRAPFPYSCTGYFVSVHTPPPLPAVKLIELDRMPEKASLAKGKVSNIRH